jgi:hypothetical protein
MELSVRGGVPCGRGAPSRPPRAAKVSTQPRGDVPETVALRM